MATIKSYTDIEQSRKLAEILPLESADMHYNNASYRGVDYTEHFSAELMPYQESLHLMKIHKTNFMFQVIPCWSLAALLDVLPNCTNIVKEEADTENEKYMCTVGVKDDIICTFGNNPVDACVAMIIKLNELKKGE